MIEGKDDFDLLPKCPVFPKSLQGRSHIDLNPKGWFELEEEFAVSTCYVYMCKANTLFVDMPRLDITSICSCIQTHTPNFKYSMATNVGLKRCSF